MTLAKSHGNRSSVFALQKACHVDLDVRFEPVDQPADQRGL